MFKVNNKDNRTYFTLCSSVSIVNFEQVNAGWVPSFLCYSVKHECVRKKTPKEKKFNSKDCLTEQLIRQCDSTNSNNFVSLCLHKIHLLKVH